MCGQSGRLNGMQKVITRYISCSHRLPHNQGLSKLSRRDEYSSYLVGFAWFTRTLHSRIPYWNTRTRFNASHVVVAPHCITSPSWMNGWNISMSLRRMNFSTKLLLVKSLIWLKRFGIVANCENYAIDFLAGQSYTCCYFVQMRPPIYHHQRVN